MNLLLLESPIIFENFYRHSGPWLTSLVSLFYKNICDSDNLMEKVT